MKKILPILLIFSAGSLVINSCATLSTAYVDDIYYNPDTDSKPIVKRQVQVINPNDSTELSSEYTGESNNGDYSEDEFTNRLQKFHDDEYQGGYYEDDNQWNMGFNFGFSPYGSSWGMSFGYGYPYYGYGYPYYGYNYWYDPFYSWYYPFYPYYGYYPPYYGGCCGCYYSDYRIYGENNNGYVYGPRRGASSNSGGSTVTAGGSNARNATNIKGGSALESNSSAMPTGSPVGVQRSNATATENKGNISSANVIGTAKVAVNNAPESNGSQLPETVNSNSLLNNSALKTGTETPVSSNNKVVKNSQSLTDAVRARNQSKNRSGYTPSYTRPSSSSTRAYNNSGYSSQTRNTNGYLNSGNRPNNEGNSTPKNNSKGSSYSVPSRNSGSSGTTYSAPRSGNNSFSSPRSGSSSSGSSYTAPRSNDSSKPKSGNSSGSSYTAPRSGSSSSSGSSYSAPRSNSGSSGSGSSSGSSSFGTRRK